MGLGMLVAPVLTMISADYLPSVVLLLATIVAFYTFIRERTHVDWSVYLLLLAGRVPGTVLGSLLLLLVSPFILKILLFLMIVVGLIGGFVGWTPKVRRSNLLIGGLLSGLFGTATSIGGPPIMVVLRSFKVGSIRATLSAILFTGGALSLVGVYFAGSLSGGHVLLAVKLVPFLVLGMVLSNIIIKFLSRNVLYYFALSSSLVGSSAMILESI